MVYQSRGVATPELIRHTVRERFHFGSDFVTTYVRGGEVRTFSKQALAVVAAVAAMVAVPITAYADGTGNVTIPINRTEANGAKTSAMTGSVAEYSGDCSMNVPSFVSISPPTAFGNSLVQWEGSGYTRHTNHADVWNLYLNFKDAAGNFVISAPVLHGAQMTQWYHVYGWDSYTSVSITQDQFNRIGQVQWLGTC
jgi:hypothetical protein